MEKLAKIATLVMVGLIVLLALQGCGQVEQMYEQTNYESLTNEKGHIKCYSGGVLVAEYTNAKILYSAADSGAAFITDNFGKQHYWQGEMLVDLR